MTETLVSWDGKKAKKIRATIIKTGINKSNSGGGGNGGNTNGSTKSEMVNTTKTMMDVKLKYLII